MSEMEIDDALFQIFLMEVTGYVEILQSSDASLVDRIDAAHGMKGASAMLGFDQLSRVAAELERLFRADHLDETQPMVLRVFELVEEIKKQRSLQAPEDPTTDEVSAGQNMHETGPDAQGNRGEPEPDPIQEPERPTTGRESETRANPPSTMKAGRSLVPDPGIERVTVEPSREATSTGVSKQGPQRNGTEEQRQPKPDGNQDSSWDPDTLSMLQGIFREEAAEHLDQMEAAISTLADDDSSKEAIHQLFRSVHTLKGAAGTVGLDVLGRAAHRLEEMLDRVRDRGRMTGQELAIVEQALDLLRSASQNPDSMTRAESAMEAILGRAPTQSTQSDGTASEQNRPEDDDAASDGPTSEGKEFRDSPEGSRQGRQAYAPLPERRRREDRREGGRRDSDIRVVRIPIEDIDGLMDLLAEFVFARTRIHKRAQELSDLVSDLSKTHRSFRHEVIGSGSAAGSAFRRRMAELEVELADEQSNLDRAVMGLTEESEWLGKVAGRLQEDLVKLRMQSIEFLMLRLERAAASAARNLDRKVDIILTGKDTKLDRAVAERLVDPMVHLVRNAVSHGIESPEERIRLAKPKKGTIRIVAQNEGDFAILEVSDDGRGIDADTIRRAAQRMRLADEEELRKMDDSDVLHLIFAPGFTTKDEADKISGRGVGLDVVHSTVSAMGGEVEVRSIPGRGTTFVLRLPILAAITNALLFKVGGEVMAVSISHVGESCLIDPEVFQDNQPTATVSGRQLPIVDLPTLLGVTRRTRGRFVPGFVVRWERSRFVVTCDRIVGPRQIVVRPLNPLLASLPYYYGATISGSGKVQLVMDPAALAMAAGTRFDPEVPDSRVPAETEAYGGKRVLVCDDSRSIREVLIRVLLEAGYEVEPAVDGWDAWERMSASDFDVVVTDLEMPRMDGYSLIERIRKSPRHRSLPVLVLTSRTAETNRIKARQAGADLFMTKPIKKRLILEQVERALAQGRAAYRTHQDRGRYKS